MIKVLVHQIFDTLPKDITLYLNNIENALKLAMILSKDTSVLEVSIYRDNELIRKEKNEINFLKHYGKGR